jgi:hypothetical protein
LKQEAEPPAEVPALAPADNATSGTAAPNVTYAAQLWQAAAALTGNITNSTIFAPSDEVRVGREGAEYGVYAHPAH